MIKRLLLIFLIVFSLGYNFIWENYNFEMEGKQIDFNNKILIFAGQGNNRSGDITEPLKYENLSNGCQIIYGLRFNSDFEMRIYTKEGEYKRFYFPKYCQNVNELSTYVSCPNNDKCYVFVSCIYNGTKIFCPGKEYPEDINVTNRSLIIYEIDSNDPFNPKVIFNKTGFKFNYEAPEFECNEKEICFLENSPYLGPGGYIADMNNPMEITHKNFDFNYDSIYLISKDDYLYTYKGKLYYNKKLIGEPKRKIFGCVMYNKSTIYCIMNNNLLDAKLYEININKLDLKEIKDFSGYGYFDEFKTGFVKDEKVVFVIMSNDINMLRWWYFIYDPKNKQFKIVLAEI